ncbi:MAG: hypothetical protein SchgKO_18220 [Schleiferiaceae bacterium]
MGFYLITIGIIQFLALYLGIEGSGNNMPLYHLYVGIEFFWIWILLKPIIPTPKNSSALFIGALLAFEVFVIINSAWIQDMSEYPSFTRTTESILIIAVSIYYFYSTLIQKMEKNLLRSPFFWLASGLLIYFSCNLLLFIFGNYISDRSSPLFRSLWSVHAVLNILLYLSYSVAVLCNPKSNK